jgi:hypothetical protein
VDKTQHCNTLYLIRTNPAEHAICTWKYHVVAIRAGTPKTYWVSNWCKDLEQTDITINMVHRNTKKPVHESMEGMFPFASALIALICTECMIHITPN